jgi:hypothetical protein
MSAGLKAYPEVEADDHADLRVAIADDFDSVPTEMKSLDQWVVWRKVHRGGNATKVPFRATMPILEASSTDPSTWSSFRVALDAFSNPASKLDGIGLVFSEGDPYAGVDLDNCLDKNGVMLPWAREILARLPGYAEVSPSGKGVKLFVRGAVPEGKGRKKQQLGQDRLGAIECYDRGRYFTVTGRLIHPDHASPVDAQAELSALHAEWFPLPLAEEDRPHQAPQTPTNLDDRAVFDKATRARNSHKFTQLWNGSLDGYPSKSEADLALCSAISFFTQDAAQVERLFNQSGLVSDKWMERPDYRQRTISRSLERATTYDPGYRSGPTLGGSRSNGRHSGDPEREPDQAPGDDGPSEDVNDLWPVPAPEIFHGIAGEIVRAADPHTEGDPVAVMLSLLIGFGNAIGRGPHWSVSGTKHFMSLFGVTVGPTGSGRKGTAWGTAKFFLRDLDPDWAESRTPGGLASGEGLIYHVRDETRKVNKDGEEVVDDPGVRDKRLFAVESEFSRTLKNMSGEKSTLSDMIRKVWDCDEKLSNLTKNSPNVATGAHVSLIGHVTMADLQKHLSSTDSANGFGNRFLWICARKSKSLPDGGNLEGLDWSRLRARFADAYRFARDVGRMGFDPEAAAIWRGVYEDLGAGRAGLLGAILSRAEPQVKRIACVYALLDRSADVRAEHLRAALALWEYAEASAKYIFGESHGDARAEKLIAALRDAPDGLKRSQISIDVFGRNLAKDALAKVLQDLLSAGLIHRVTRGEGRGRPAEIWLAGRGTK